MDAKTEKVVKWLSSQLEVSKAAIEKFRKELAEYPAHALEWSDEYFVKAAKIEIYGRIHTYLTKENGDLNLVQQSLDKNIKSGARNQTRSTSASTNRMSLARLEAYADLDETIHYS